MQPLAGAKPGIATGTVHDDPYEFTRAGLFVADEKVVRVLRRVLSELEIGMELCADAESSHSQTDPPEGLKQ